MHQEKIYKTMENAGVLNITVGIIILIAGATAGVLTIINGAKLLVRKNDVIL